ncbi:MAG TPA: hypothetical protein VMN82_08400 [Thermoanaerobaculia bacterium]|nr:hypothetical protein [Thermoanaerobaculia bacterium]
MGRLALAPDLPGSRRLGPRGLGARSSVPAAAGLRGLLQSTGAERSAIFVGLVAAFVAAVEVVRWIRLDLLLDPEPSWAAARLLLTLFVAAATAAVGVASAAFCGFVARTRLGERSAYPLPLRRSGLLVLGAGVLAIGVLLRLFGASTLGPLWVDDLSEVRPAVALRGEASDLSSWSYPVPFREGRWGGSVGTLYLELFHLTLRTFGTTMTGIRAPSVLGGILSLFTAVLLGRAFLPRGGGALTAVILAGLRWSLIVSQWGWNAIVVAPILDLAALSMLEARRRNRWILAGVSGVIAGLGAHVHIVGWIGAASLGLWAIWPSERRVTMPRRALLGAVFTGGLVLATLPILRDDPLGHYFSRIAGRSRPPANVSVETRLWWNVETAHAALTGPWWTPDRAARHDLPGRFRLGGIVGLALAAALLKAVLTPRDELSAYLLASAAAAFVSTLAWGRGGTPNSYRYGYLSTTTAIAAAGGALWLLSAIPWPRRRVAAYAVLGGFAISGALGSRDALVVWPNHAATFAGFGGQDTLVGQAAARWDRYGRVTIDPSVAGDRIVIDNVRAFRLDASAERANEPAGAPARSLRIAPTGARPTPSQRVVERITDGWGREWGVVLASVPGRPPATAHRASPRHVRKPAPASSPAPAAG